MDRARTNAICYTVVLWLMIDLQSTYTAVAIFFFFSSFFFISESESIGELKRVKSSPQQFLVKLFLIWTRVKTSRVISEKSLLAILSNEFEVEANAVLQGYKQVLWDFREKLLPHFGRYVLSRGSCCTYIQRRKFMLFVRWTSLLEDVKYCEKKNYEFRKI